MILISLSRLMLKLMRAKKFIPYKQWKKYRKCFFKDLNLRRKNSRQVLLRKPNSIRMRQESSIMMRNTYKKITAYKLMDKPIEIKPKFNKSSNQSSRRKL